MNELIDATLLKPDATLEDYDKFLFEASRLKCRSVVVPTSLLEDPAIDWSELRKSLKICTVVGFPLGNNSTFEKIDVIKRYEDSVDEFDIVLNVGWMKSGYWDLVIKELDLISNQCHADNVFKFIIEAPLLNGDDIFQISSLILLQQQKNYRIKFIKTATGFNGSTTPTHVKVIKSALGMNQTLGIKASGGIRTKEQIAEFSEAGGTIFGVGYPYFIELLK